MVISSKARSRIVFTGLVVGFVVLALLLLVPTARKVRKTYCSRCGALKTLQLTETLLASWSSETIELVSFVDPGLSGRCRHSFVKPAGRPENLWRGLPNRELARNHALLNRFKILSQLAAGKHPHLLHRISRQSRERRRELWDTWLDPDNLLLAHMLGVFDLDTSSDSQWAVWTSLRQMYQCMPGQDFSCALVGPYQQLLMTVVQQRLRRIFWDFAYYTPGTTPPPFLFGTKSYEPEDTAESERARALLKGAVSHLGLARRSPPHGVDYTYLKKDLRHKGHRARESKLVDTRYGGRFWHESAKGNWGYGFSVAREKVYQLPSGEPLPPNFLHVWKKSLFAATPALHLSRALAPNCKLRHLGQVVVDGRRLDKLLILVDDRYATMFLIDKRDYSVAAMRRWAFTTEGQAMLTTWLSDWRSVDGILVPYAHTTELGWPSAFDGREGTLHLDPGALTSSARAKTVKWSGASGLLATLGVFVKDYRLPYRQSTIEQWRWDPEVSEGNFVPPK